jgi:hypothetical protein
MKDLYEKPIGKGLDKYTWKYKQADLQIVLIASIYLTTRRYRSVHQHPERIGTDIRCACRLNQPTMNVGTPMTTSYKFP